MNNVRLAPLSYRLGVEVLDVEIAAPMSDAVFGEIHRAFLDHDGLMLFRDQRISREQHVAFSRRFGELDTHDAVPLDRHPDHHEVLIVANEAVVENQNNDRYVGQTWHSDLASSLRPAMGSLLRAVTVPPIGGDTMFTNMYAAYEALSDSMKRIVSGLHGVYVRERKDLSVEWQAKNRDINPPVAQPVVRVHPETGRKALYIGEKVKTFEGMSAEESRPLIEFLVRHATRPQFVYRHRWRADDLLMWDNRCTMHLALGDFDPSKRRHLERTTVVGTPSGHFCNTESIAIGA